ncbi:MAG TPA: DMT family transporter [Bdellovibrionales bacterium]|nr:DMT family transporter [Bdellovibrionales bacterium]
MTEKRSSLLASAELLVAAGLWGFGFIAAIWALQGLSAVQITFWRFFLAALLLLYFLTREAGRVAMRENLRLSFWPAVLLLSTLLLQTWGLMYTTATKSGFITTLYVVFVPLFEAVWRRERLPFSICLCVGTALFGTGLIVNFGIGDFNYGDLLTLICAVFAALQICVVGAVSVKVRKPFVFNLVQSGWATLLCLPLFLYHPVPVAPPAVWTPQIWTGILTLAFGSTVIAFYLQVRAQAHLSATVSSILFLLESPFAMVFAMLLLNESLDRYEAVGATLIFLSALAASLLEARRKKF